MSGVSSGALAAIRRFLLRLIDQESARIVVPPKKAADGYWFGGGNMIEHDGDLYLIGRYRNAGDSRTGLAAGERGLELALLKSDDRGKSFEHVQSWTKDDLSSGGSEVLSIEGSCLVRRGEGFSLFVSTEKRRPYPKGLEDFLKPGTGVWSIDEFLGLSPDSLDVRSIHPVLESEYPEYLHVKDPFWHEQSDGRGVLFFCTHPYGWSSHNTGYMVANESGFDEPVFDFFDRGPTWDVAMSRATDILPLPPLGELRGTTPLSVLFYDGGECLRRLDEHRAARTRPRGYSCEELGGAALIPHDDYGAAERISRIGPLFVSPHGTGSSRYVDVLVTREGYYATWQQSQPDCSQPLVMNHLSHAQAEALLSDEENAGVAGRKNR